MKFVIEGIDWSTWNPNPVAQMVDVVQMYFDMQIQFFQFYADCGIEKFIIEVSFKFFTLRGFLANLVNFGFLWDKIMNDGVFQRAVITAMNIANFSGKSKDWRNVGMYVGAIAAEILGFRIPGYEYIYG